MAFNPGGTFAPGFSATSGIVAYRSGSAGVARQLTWLDRSGKDACHPPGNSRLKSSADPPDSHRQIDMGPGLDVGRRDPGGVAHFWVKTLALGAGSAVLSLSVN